jgi:anti-anti-sigma regulatory factor
MRVSANGCGPSPNGSAPGPAALEAAGIWSGETKLAKNLWKARLRPPPLGDNRKNTSMNVSTAMESVCDTEPTGITILRLEREYGSADMPRLAQLEGCLLGAIDSSPAGLLIDLSETTLIGCGFLNVLIQCYARARESNCRFALCALNSWPESVLVIARLDSLWEIFRTPQEAIEAMQAPRHNENTNDGRRRRTHQVPSHTQEGGSHAYLE